MRLRLQTRRGGRITSIWIMVMLAFLLSNPAAAIPPVSKNKLTIINQSGEDTNIKIMGPREWILEIPNGQERTILLPSGDYTYLTRFGQDPDFRYARGTPFQIEPSRVGFTEATLTLISAPGAGPADPLLVEQFNRPITPPPETAADEKMTSTTEKPPSTPQEPPPMEATPQKKPPPLVKSPPPVKSPPVAKTTPKEKSGEKFILHPVTNGDTLPSISNWYSGEADFWPEIAKHNPGLNPLRLKPGTLVKIPAYLTILHKAPPKSPADTAVSREKKNGETPSPAPSPPHPLEGFGPK